MQPFVYNSLPGKVVFGRGTLAQVGDEVRALGCSRALVLTTPTRETTGRELAAQIGEFAVGIFAGAAMHTPVEVTEKAMAVVAETGADCVVAIGGGSAIGLGKAIALRTELLQVVLPTTYAGSEATPNLGQTENGVKTTQRDAKILPEVILYDVDLTVTLPPAISVASGLNAIAHSVEGLYSPDANPLISLLAEDGIRALVSALPRIVERPSDISARSDALYGAWACGTTLGAVGMGLHHKLCHTLGGAFGLSHAETHSVILPHAMAYNARAAADAMAKVARAIGADDAPRGMWDLSKQLGAPMTLAQLGMPRDGIARAVELALANPYWNPEPLEAGRLTTLLEDAFEGRPPREME